MGDWMHINSMSVLGPNKWYDAGDERFHPDNIIVDGREANIIFIISKATGKITWKLGPDYDNSPVDIIVPPPFMKVNRNTGGRSAVSFVANWFITNTAAASAIPQI